MNFPLKQVVKPGKKILWRARVLMAERGVRSVSDLMRRLDSVGVSISVAQLGRMIDGKTDHWNQAAIEGMLTVFDCEVGDLFKTV